MGTRGCQGTPTRPSSLRYRRTVDKYQWPKHSRGGVRERESPKTEEWNTEHGAYNKGDISTMREDVNSELACAGSFSDYPLS